MALGAKSELPKFKNWGILVIVGDTCHEPIGSTCHAVPFPHYILHFASQQSLILPLTATSSLSTVKLPVFRSLSPTRLSLPPSPRDVGVFYNTLPFLSLSMTMSFSSRFVFHAHIARDSALSLSMAF
ncbi:hypothetical protein VNO78_28264 [Psophocarpus tetragonolobus]|uniref:Uncharacterized protein n=1 Tax=Psophocarpus tetragonolobus TaxID=3891 RepID=A0AAN9XD46_PSOTE